MKLIKTATLAAIFALALSTGLSHAGQITDGSGVAINASDGTPVSSPEIPVANINSTPVLMVFMAGIAGLTLPFSAAFSYPAAIGAVMAGFTWLTE